MLAQGIGADYMAPYLGRMGDAHMAGGMPEQRARIQVRRLGAWLGARGVQRRLPGGLGPARSREAGGASAALAAGRVPSVAAA
jgi:hypothetical protein